MNFEWLYSFLETSRQKSLSKASESLNLTQPALSKQIRHLENELGVIVFRRSASGVELTKEGKLLLERIQPILNEYESLKKDLVNLNQIKAIRLASLPSLATHYLPQRLTEMSRQGIQIEMSVLSTSVDIIGMLQSGAVDIAIVQKSAAIPKNSWSTDLFRETFYAVIPETHPLVTKDSFTLSDLADEALIVYPRQCDVRNSIVEAYHSQKLEPNLAVEVAFGESIPGFISSGAGISILPEIIAKHVRPSLKVIPIKAPTLSRTLSLVTLKPDLGKRIHRYFK